MRACAIIPTYNHVARLAEICAALRAHGLDVLIVDDGNREPNASTIAALHAPDVGIAIIRRPENGGKGAAMQTGFHEALRQSYSHALQIDADGQHDLAQIGAFLAAARSQPEAMICGQAMYDHSVPKSRQLGRYLTHGCVWLETGSLDIQDSLCGFRVYPLAPMARLLRGGKALGARMDFDIEIAVRLHWLGVRIISLPTRVNYPPGNTSNFQMLRDNARISWLHTRLIIQAPFRLAWKALMREAAKGSSFLPPVPPTDEPG